MEKNVVSPFAIEEKSGIQINKQIVNSTLSYFL